MLIDGYEIDLYCPACDPGSEAWVATVNTVAELSELMPYVNAVVEKGEYIPGVPTLVWREGAHKLFLKSRQVGINNLHDRAHAAVSYTHLRAHETRHDLVCRLLL